MSRITAALRGWLPSAETANQFLTLTVLPLVVGVLANLIASKIGLFGALGVSPASIARALSELGTWAVSAFIAFLAAHHILRARAELRTSHMLGAIDGGVRKHKGGRLPGVVPPSLRDLSAYLTGHLAPAPAAWPAPKVTLPMDGNNQYGDCTIAGIAHLIAVWNTLFKRALKVPTLKQIISTYLKLSPHDTGCVEANVLKLFATNGLFGEKAAAYAPVNPRNLELIKQAIVNYGAAYLGIMCPQSAETQFEKDEPWTYMGEATEDGHCVVAIGFTEEGLLCATWGGVALLTWGFLAHYLQEAWVILSQQLVEAKQNTLGIDLKVLQADIAKA